MSVVRVIRTVMPRRVSSSRRSRATWRVTSFSVTPGGRYRPGSARVDAAVPGVHRDDVARQQAVRQPLRHRRGGGDRAPLHEPAGLTVEAVELAEVPREDLGHELVGHEERVAPVEGRDGERLEPVVEPEERRVRQEGKVLAGDHHRRPTRRPAGRSRPARRRAGAPPPSGGRRRRRRRPGGSPRAAWSPPAAPARGGRRATRGARGRSSLAAHRDGARGLAVHHPLLERLRACRAASCRGPARWRSSPRRA